MVHATSGSASPLLTTPLARALRRYGTGTVAAAGARMQAPNSGSPGSVTMGDSQGSLAEQGSTACVVGNFSPP
jgi:hypothetical protein